jgi:uncharacterized protein YjbI with pentapeptide repeats
MSHVNDKGKLLKKLRSAFKNGDVRTFNATRVKLDKIGVCAPDLAGIRLKQKLALRGINLQRARLRDVHFAGSDLTQADLREAACREVDLSRCDLTEAKLKGANLKKARFLEADVRRADFRKCKLDGAVFYVKTKRKKKAKKAKHLGSASFRGASQAPDLIARFL